MKYLVVLVLCATAAFAEIIMDNKSLKQFRDECARQYNINLDSRDELMKSCFFECYGKKIGMIKEDGTYDVEGLLVNAETPEIKEVGRRDINAVLQSCRGHAGDNPCVMATCVLSMTTP